MNTRTMGKVVLCCTAYFRSTECNAHRKRLPCNCCTKLRDVIGYSVDHKRLHKISALLSDIGEVN